jgi:biopolymer transport protein ExbB/TolQ
MRKLFPTEFVYQAFSLLIAFIVVHAIYVAVIRPNAESFMAEEKARIAADKDYIQQRSYYVVLRDFEQETCFVLMLWAMAILGYKGFGVRRQQRQLERDFIGVAEGAAISPQSAADVAGRIRAMPEALRDLLLPRILLAALERFTTTRGVQDASSVVHAYCDSEGGRLESELSIIRYIAWAIPAIGFIGTVRGIGDALAQAHRAVEGDISGVTDSLGVAFNSTFIALVISIVLMFLVHHIQLVQERLVLDSERYCDNWLIRRLEG